MLIRRTTWPTLLAICLAGVLGCGSDGVKIVPVEGSVKLDGKPLNRIMVEFWPESKGPRSFGETDDQGNFKLMTDNGEDGGAAVGSHKVLVKDVSVLGDTFLGRGAENVNMSQGRKSRISNKYSNIETSTLTFKVEPKGENKFDIQVTK